MCCPSAARRCFSLGRAARLPPPSTELGRLFNWTTTFHPRNPNFASQRSRNTCPHVSTEFTWLSTQLAISDRSHADADSYSWLTTSVVVEVVRRRPGGGRGRALLGTADLAPLQSGRLRDRMAANNTLEACGLCDE